MLVITRKRTESILLSGGIKITVLSLGRDSVRIGIEAPPDVEIWREEIAPAEFLKGEGK